MILKRWNRDVMERKLQNITKYLNLLRSCCDWDLQTYSCSLEQQAVVERGLHLVLEFAADLNAYILLQLGYPPPETYPDSFIELQRLGILPGDLAQELAVVARLRNRLVHLYEELDPGAVLRYVPVVITQFSRYIEQILRFLERHHAP